MLVQGTILHRPDTHSPILGFTGDYDPLEWKDWYPENYLENGAEDADAEDDMIENNEAPIACCIYEFSYDSGMCSELNCFTGMDGTSLIAEYIPYINGFSLFNYNRMQMELFDCGDGSITPVFPEITEAYNMPPSHFHPHAHHPEECYIMYPHACYLVDPDHPDSSGTKMEYYVDKTAKLLPEGNVADKPHFRTSVSPVDGRFIVIDDRFIYEWDSEHARLF